MGGGIGIIDSGDGYGAQFRADRLGTGHRVRTRMYDISGSMAEVVDVRGPECPAGVVDRCGEVKLTGGGC